MKLIRCCAGLYRNEASSLRIVERSWENKAFPWLLEWKAMDAPGFFSWRRRRFRTLGDARAFIRDQGW